MTHFKCSDILTNKRQLVAKKKMFYGWWIVAGGFILNFVGIGIGINAIGVFFKPVIESQGFSRGDFSLYFTIAALSMTVAAPFVGKLMEKFDVRIIMGVCILFLSAGFALYSQCTKLIHFYLLSVLVGIGHGGSHIIPVSTMISNWFREKRGLALGIVFTATGFGGLVFNPLTNWLIISYGWRHTYLILGILIGVVCLPVAVAMMRLSPQQMGLAADGRETVEQVLHDKPAEGMSLGAFVKTSTFWLLALLILFINMINMGIQQHLIPYLTDLKHSSTFAANIMGLYLGMTIAGKLILGRISDTKGLTKSLVIFTGVFVAGITMLFGAQLVLFVVLFCGYLWNRKCDSDRSSAAYDCRMCGTQTVPPDFRNHKYFFERSALRLECLYRDTSTTGKAVIIRRFIST